MRHTTINPINSFLSKVPKQTQFVNKVNNFISTGNVNY
jgi:hypothetical protein